MSTGLFTLIVVAQVAVFIALALIAVRLVKVIKSQNNGMILSPETSKKLRKMFGRSPKS